MNIVFSDVRAVANIGLVIDGVITGRQRGKDIWLEMEAMG